MELAYLTVVSKPQIYLPNSSYVEEDEVVEEDFLVDWAFPPIYDFYPKDEDLLEEVSLSVCTKNFVEENDVYHAFDKSRKSEVFDLGLEEISLLIS